MSNRNSKWGLVIGLGFLPILLAIDGGTYSENQARLSAMSEEQLQQLWRRKESFDRLTPQEQDRLRQVDQAIHAEPNSEHLLQALRGYQEWLSSLGSMEQAKLQDLPIDKRIAKMKSLISQNHQRDIGLSDQTRLVLTEDFEAISKWARELGERKKDEIAKLFAQLQRPMPARGGLRSPMTRLVLVIRGTTQEEKLDDLVTEDDLAQLSKSLSDKAAKILDDQKSKPEKVRLIAGWINESVVPRISDAEKIRIFNEVLSQDDRDEINRLGPIEGRQRLLFLFRQSRNGRGQSRNPDGERSNPTGELPRQAFEIETPPPGASAAPDNPPSPPK